MKSVVKSVSKPNDKLELFSNEVEQYSKTLPIIFDEIMTYILPKVLIHITLEYCSMMCIKNSMIASLSKKKFLFESLPGFVLVNNVPMLTYYNERSPHFIEPFPNVSIDETNKIVNEMNKFFKDKTVIIATSTKTHIHIIYIPRTSVQHKIVSFSVADGKITKEIDINKILLSRFKKTRYVNLKLVRFLVNNGVIYVGYKPKEEEYVDGGIIAFDENEVLVNVYSQKNYFKIEQTKNIHVHSLNPNNFVVINNKIFVQDYAKFKINIYDVKSGILEAIHLIDDSKKRLITYGNKCYVLGINIQSDVLAQPEPQARPLVERDENVYMFCPHDFSVYVFDLKFNLLRKIKFKSDERLSRLLHFNLITFCINGDKMYCMFFNGCVSYKIHCLFLNDNVIIE